MSPNLHIYIVYVEKPLVGSPSGRRGVFCFAVGTIDFYFSLLLHFKCISVFFPLHFFGAISCWARDNVAFKDRAGVCYVFLSLVHGKVKRKEPK